MHMADTGTGKSWWREPWPWILMAGPFLAIIGCVITIVLAVQNYGDQDIKDGGVKRGFVVTRQAPASGPAASEPVVKQP
jgi:hypothetical protein